MMCGDLRSENAGSAVKHITGGASHPVSPYESWRLQWQNHLFRDCANCPVKQSMIVFRFARCASTEGMHMPESRDNQDAIQDEKKKRRGGALMCISKL